MTSYNEAINYNAAINYNGVSASPSDTHDGWIPDHIVRKFYENERLKHSTVIRLYKEAIEAEPDNVELQEIVSEFTPDTSRITVSQLNEIADDKLALTRLLASLSMMEERIIKYRKDTQDDELLFMIAATMQ